MLSNSPFNLYKMPLDSDTIHSKCHLVLIQMLEYATLFLPLFLSQYALLDEPDVLIDWLASILTPAASHDHQCMIQSWNSNNLASRIVSCQEVWEVNEHTSAWAGAALRITFCEVCRVFSCSCWFLVMDDLLSCIPLIGWLWPRNNTRLNDA